MICYLTSKYLYPVVKYLEMNQLCSSEVLLPEKDMRYKLRIVSVHTGQGGCFKEQETKKKGRKRGRKDEAHYYGYLCNFVSSKWYKLDDNDVDDVEENDMLLDVRDKAYMLHYICYGSEEYNLCYQEDKSLFPSLKVNHTALSQSENYATPPNTTQ